MLVFEAKIRTADSDDDPAGGAERHITAAVLSSVTKPKEDLEHAVHSWRRATIGSNRVARRAGM